MTFTDENPPARTNPVAPAKRSADAAAKAKNKCDANGNPNGGGDKVDAYATFDMHLAYDFDQGWLSGYQVYVTMSNIADRHPPFYNSQGQASITGTDDLVTNLIGRLTVAGFRAKF